MTPSPDLLQLKLDRLFETMESRKQTQRGERQAHQDRRIEKLTTRRPLWWQK